MVLKSWQGYALGAVALVVAYLVFLRKTVPTVPGAGSSGHDRSALETLGQVGGSVPSDLHGIPLGAVVYTNGDITFHGSPTQAQINDWASKGYAVSVDSVGGSVILAPATVRQTTFNLPNLHPPAAPPPSASPGSATDPTPVGWGTGGVRLSI